LSSAVSQDFLLGDVAVILANADKEKGKMK
jgi:hypothetical protein